MTGLSAGAAADRLANTLQEIQDADLDGVRAVWLRHYGRPPALRSLPVLRLMLAWRLQADAHGVRIEPELRRELKKTGQQQLSGRELGLGTKLSREHEGELIEVVVEEDGFRWRDKLYRSLSAVATAATGTRWNGPRFFGLKG